MGNSELKKKVTGSEAILMSLLEEGVDTIFGYPGGAIMPFYDALMDYEDRIHHVLTRHEQGAVHAAQGYARVNGEVGVCVATSGPGATNLITGIADAMLDSTPMVCISGQVASPLLGSDAFQEIDVVGVSMPISKWNLLVTKAEDIPEVLAKAFFIARSGRPGPVLVDITKDAQFGEFEYNYHPIKAIRSYDPIPKIEPAKIDEAAALINKAQKPFALVGQGVILGGAEAECLKFLEKADIPFGWTILGNSAIPNAHPLNQGMLGMHGNYAPNIKTNECDVLIAIGMRFDDRVTGDLNSYAKQAKIIHLELDAAEINKNVVVDVPVLGDVKTTLPMLFDKVNANMHTEWRDSFKELWKVENDKVIKDALYPQKDGITMGEVINLITEHTNNEAILVTDVGQHQMKACRYFKFKNTRSVVTSGGLGTMGFGLPAALGAAFGQPEKDVVLFVGDGGIQMTIQELGTIAQQNCNVKIVLLNNNFLGMVRQWQQLFFEKRYSFTELTNPNFQMISEGFGVKANKVVDRDELKGAIEKMFEKKGPAFLEVTVEKEENVFPMVPSGASVSDILLEP
ncbi:biosynthetic-type acetolactate synthase large subunit [Bacteroidales bacterium]|nr:biosynthetic-type acetolactate synthase large subunit [Bacteroidales bacterium]